MIKEGYVVENAITVSPIPVRRKAMLRVFFYPIKSASTPVGISATADVSIPMDCKIAACGSVM